MEFISKCKKKTQTRRQKNETEASHQLKTADVLFSVYRRKQIRRSSTYCLYEGVQGQYIALVKYWFPFQLPKLANLQYAASGSFG